MNQPTGVEDFAEQMAGTLAADYFRFMRERLPRLLEEWKASRSQGARA
jgi:hypothetical protein